MVRLPGLLGADLTELTRLHPASGSAEIKMQGTSEATLTLPEDAPAISIHDWISIYTISGLAGIYRVSNVAQNYKKQIDVTLLHGIDVLSDSVWDEQTEFEGTKAQYLTALLDRQTRLINGVKPWVLGSCADTSTIKRSINYDRLSNLLEDLEEDGGDYYFVYDQSVFPWRISLAAKPQGAESEFRLTRNIRSATVTYNDADLCTRLHLSVNVKKTDPETETTSTDTAIRTYNNTAAQATWGIVVKTADIDTEDDIAGGSFPEADAWAQAFLAKRAEPSVQIQIDGEDLSALTGDTWDEHKIGRMCRVALPEYGHTFVERVTSVSYPDLYKVPDRVTVSLANTLPRFSESIANAQKNADQAKKRAAAVGRSAAEAKELTTWSQHVKYYGEALDGTGVLTLYESGIDMDAQGGVRIFSLQEGLRSLYAGIEVTATQIRAEVSAGLCSAHSELVMTANQIRAEVADELSGVAEFLIEANQIKAEVRDAVSNVAALQVEANQIRAEVQNAMSEMSVFIVEADQIRTEVHNALSEMAEFVVEASQIRAIVEGMDDRVSSLEIGTSQIRVQVAQKKRVWYQWEDPTSAAGGSNSPDVGDEWHKTRDINSWGDAEDSDWSTMGDVNWAQAAGIEKYVWNGSGWVLINSYGEDLINGARLTITDDKIAAVVSDVEKNYSSLVQTADRIRTYVANVQDGLSTSITQTASMIRLEASDAINNVQAHFDVTASEIRAEVETARSEYAALIITANQIRQEVSNAESDYAAFMVSANQVRTEVGNARSDYAAFMVSANQVRTEVGNARSDYAAFMVSANQVKTEVGNARSDYAAFMVSANQVKTEVGNARSDYAAFMVSANQVKTEVGNARSEYASFMVSANQIRTEVNNAASQCASFVVEASQIKQEVLDETNGLSARIQTNAGRIALVVNTTNNTIKRAAIVAAINGNTSSVDISADKISIDGQTALSGVLTLNGGDLFVSGRTVYAKGFSGQNVVVSNNDDSYTLSASNVGGIITDLKVVLSGNTYKIQRKTVGAPNSWADIPGTSFSRATTLTGAWSGGTYTVTASPQGNSKGDTVYLGPEGAGTANNFSVCVYHTSTAAANRIDSLTTNVYLTEDVTNKYVHARWGSSSGTAYARISTQNTWNAGYTVYDSQISVSNLSIQPSTADRGQRTQAGSLSKSSIQGPGYLFFQVACHGRTKYYYITVNP